VFERPFSARNNNFYFFCQSEIIGESLICINITKPFFVGAVSFFSIVTVFMIIKHIAFVLLRAFCNSHS